ncbi:hypothetical protein ACHAXS_004521 [Conticribra weissflogii]
MDVYPKSKCVRLVKAFKEFDKESVVSKEDKLLLSFNLKKNANEVKISHLIVFYVDVRKFCLVRIHSCRGCVVISFSQQQLIISRADRATPSSQLDRKL